MNGPMGKGGRGGEGTQWISDCSQGRWGSVCIMGRVASEGCTFASRPFREHDLECMANRIQREHLPKMELRYVVSWCSIRLPAQYENAIGLPSRQTAPGRMASLERPDSLRRHGNRPVVQSSESFINCLSVERSCYLRLVLWVPIGTKLVNGIWGGRIQAEWKVPAKTATSCGE